MSIDFLSPAALPTECEVLVIGAGVAGATSAHALATAGVLDICVIDSGRAGVGYSTGPAQSPDSLPIFPDKLYSGSAVMSEPTSTIKMMVSLFPSSSTDFMTHHGEEGAKRYIKLATKGLELQKELARSVLPCPEEQLTELGSLYVTDESHAAALRDEFDTLVSLGCDGIELWDKEKLASVEGGNALGFDTGIYFPNDAVIDSSEYCRSLLRRIVSTGAAIVVENCPRAISIDTFADYALTTLSDGTAIRSKYAVVATGAFFVGSPDLAGILRPCFSYLVSVPEPELDKSVMSTRNSPNMFTWGFTHDWCLTKGHFRCSGEDHFSALKDPKWEERCRRLAQWTAEKYPYLLNGQNMNQLKYEAKYGIYSETPDSTAIVGRTSDSSRICYILGCNAWGQSLMSYAGHLVPGILGYAELSEEQEDNFSLLSIRRFSLLPSVNK